MEEIEEENIFFQMKNGVVNGMERFFCQRAKQDERLLDGNGSGAIPETDQAGGALRNQGGEAAR
ncbi:hypothetical protein AGMMS50230_18630 [Spirochaetia bacterium]|nr:hypothetical protein AGMMS50230_18630 [Spirochaetia bacterium]